MRVYIFAMTVIGGAPWVVADDKPLTIDKIVEEGTKHIPKCKPESMRIVLENDLKDMAAAQASLGPENIQVEKAAPNGCIYSFTYKDFP